MVRFVLNRFVFFFAKLLEEQYLTSYPLAPFTFLHVSFARFLLLLRDFLITNGLATLIFCLLFVFGLLLLFVALLLFEVLLFLLSAPLFVPVLVLPLFWLPAVVPLLPLLVLLVLLVLPVFVLPLLLLPSP